MWTFLMFGFKNLWWKCIGLLVLATLHKMPCYLTKAFYLHFKYFVKLLLFFTILEFPKRKVLLHILTSCWWISLIHIFFQRGLLWVIMENFWLLESRWPIYVLLTFYLLLLSIIFDKVLLVYFDSLEHEASSHFWNHFFYTVFKTNYI